MVGRVVLLLLVVVLGWAYEAIQPPPPKICGSPDGPPITSPRVQLSDGRHLAYREEGTPKDKSKHRIIIVHGFGSSKELSLPASPGVGVYLLLFDRAGYGESDPNPKRTVRSDAMDIQELADRLQLGHKFYVLGISMGAYPTLGSLKYIPHRLAGAALVVPAINYWWPSFPPNLSKQVYRQLLVQDQRTFWIARNLPSLLYWWMTQKWFPSSSIAQGLPSIFSRHDTEIMNMLNANNSRIENKALQQGEFESIHRDLMVLFGRWEFDPMDLTDPFPKKEGSVHIWQGAEDRLVPVQLQRYVSKRLPWIRYHECSDCGHLFFFVDGWTDRILKALLLGEEGQSSSDG